MKRDTEFYKSVFGLEFNPSLIYSRDFFCLWTAAHFSDRPYPGAVPVPWVTLQEEQCLPQQLQSSPSEYGTCTCNWGLSLRSHCPNLRISDIRASLSVTRTANFQFTSDIVCLALGYTTYTTNTRANGDLSSDILWTVHHDIFA
jgi:hypothetical protein